MGANAQTTVPTFTASQVLTADQQNQSARTGVPVFATTITRDAAFGGSGEKTLAEGQLCYVEGTGLQSYNGSAWVTWGTGGTWTSYTPTIKGGATTVTATITYAKYMQIGNTVTVQVLATVTSTGGVNGAISISVPIAPATLDVRLIRGEFFFDDTGVGIYTGGAVVTNAYGSHTAVVGFGSGPVGDVMGTAGPAVTLANNDRVGCFAVYEVS